MLSTDELQTVGAAAAALYLGWQARKANKQTKATGNGFAKEVKASLSRIEAKADATNSLMVEHLADHAESDLTRR